MGTKNGFGNAQILAIAGELSLSSASFYRGYSAKASGVASSISVNGLGSISGSGLLLGLLSGNASWEFQGIGVLAWDRNHSCCLFSSGKIQSIATFICGVLIIGGGLVNIRSIWVNSPANSWGATMQSGAGYGLYVCAAGGALAWPVVACVERWYLIKNISD